MSHEVDDYYRVYDELFPRARKEHCCGACKIVIRRGDRYARIFILGSEGEPSTVKRCLGCQHIHEHLRALGQHDGLWPDEELDCGEDYVDNWGREPPDDIAKIPFMTADEMQREQWKPPPASSPRKNG